MTLGLRPALAIGWWALIDTSVSSDLHRHGAAQEVPGTLGPGSRKPALGDRELHLTDPLIPSHGAPLTLQFWGQLVSVRPSIPATSAVEASLLIHLREMASGVRAPRAPDPELWTGIRVSAISTRPAATPQPSSTEPDCCP
jgi:hypothetical protein